nr:hypothetical protein [Methylobacterium sp. J-030]
MTRREGPYTVTHVKKLSSLKAFLPLSVAVLRTVRPLLIIS